MGLASTQEYLCLHQYLSRNAVRFAGKMFITHRDANIPYDELNALSTSLARFLKECGVRRGDRVALVLENSIEYVYSLLAILRIGAIAVPMSDQHTVRSALIHLRDFEPAAIILRQKTLETLWTAFDEIPSIRTVLIADGGFPSESRERAKSLSFDTSGRAGRRMVRLADVDKKSFLDEESPGPALSDNAMIIYTSGTTGSPKGVVLTHANIVANAFSIIRYLGLTEADSVMVVLPFFYSYGNSLLTTHLISGGTLVLENNFLYPNVVLEKMVEHGVTGFAGVPSTFSILLQRSNFRKLRFPRLRYVTQAGGAMPPRHAEELRAVLPGTGIYIMYGQTEATARLTWLDPRDLTRKYGSIGKAIPGVTITLKKENGTEAGPGEVGEIVARGDNIMAGYWNNPVETKKVLRQDGLHTGDIARQDDEGYLYIVGRRSDMIKSGAHRISPTEIEEAILEHPGVGEVAVIGIPDKTLGEAVQACIVPKGEAKLDVKEILVHCRLCLPAFKVPKRVVFVERLPKTSSGKVKRLELADILKGTTP